MIGNPSSYEPTASETRLTFDSSASATQAMLNASFRLARQTLRFHLTAVGKPYGNPISACGDLFWVFSHLARCVLS